MTTVLTVLGLGALIVVLWVAPRKIDVTKRFRRR